MSKETEILRLAMPYDSGPIEDEEIGQAGRALLAWSPAIAAAAIDLADDDI